MFEIRKTAKKGFFMEAMVRITKLLGNQTEAAKQLGELQQTVHKWCSGTQRIPAEKVLKLCIAVDYAVMPYELRPDLYKSTWIYQ